MAAHVPRSVRHQDIGGHATESAKYGCSSFPCGWELISTIYNVRVLKIYKNYILHMQFHACSHIKVNMDASKTYPILPMVVVDYVFANIDLGL